MKHTHFLALTLLIASFGCQKSQSVAETPAAPAVNAVKTGALGDASAQAISTAEIPNTSTPTQVAQPPATEPTKAAAAPPKDVPPELVALAARLVERDPDGDWRISESAALELEKQGPEAGAQLLSLLQHPTVDARRGAAFYLLGNFDPTQAEQVAAFSALLEDADRTVRGIGLSAVKQMHEADIVAAVPKLATMLDAAREDQPDNRAGIARLLGKLKAQSGSAVDSLRKAAADDPVARVRGVCLVAISQIVKPADALPAYRHALADADASVRLVAAARLRQLAADAAPAAAELGKALADADPRVADTAAETLISIGPAAVLPVVAQLEAQQPGSRKLALACLAKLGPLAKDAAPAIEKRLKDSDAEVRQLAALALKRVTGK